MINFCTHNYVIIFLLNWLIASYAFGGTKVTVFNRQLQQEIGLDYQKAIKLDKLLLDAWQKMQPNQFIYEPMTALFDVNNNKIVLKKHNILRQLDQLTINYQKNPKLLAAFSKLGRMINQLTFAYRLMIPLDLDKIRIKPYLNILLAGNYQLALVDRPSTILIVGAVNKPGMVSWVERTSASQYLIAATPLPSADNNYIWVIQPDGAVERHPIAYWNKDHQDIAPGAILYLGFSSIGSAYKQLNQDIATLLQHRVPL